MIRLVKRKGKAVTDSRLDEAYAQMPEDVYNKFVRAYAE